jgi:hypothetical protein
LTLAAYLMPAANIPTEIYRTENPPNLDIYTLAWSKPGLPLRQALFFKLGEIFASQGANFSTSFATGINDTSCKFVTGVNNT